MTIADDIEALIKRKRRLSLTEEDIADMLFGQNNAYQQRVNSACRQLVEERPGSAFSLSHKPRLGLSMSRTTRASS